MTKQNEAARSDAPAKRAEAKDDPNIEKFRAEALRIAAERAELSEEGQRVQEEYDRRNANIRPRAGKE